MSTTETVQAWAGTNAGNATADAAITSADTQSPDTIDNNIRSIMTAVTKYRKDTDGALAAGGTANALTVTTNQVLESGQLAAGLFLAVRATAANTSATVTFSPDGLSAAAVKRCDGSALAIGSIQSGAMLQLYYNSGSSEWRCGNIAPATAAATSAAAVASFSANKNAANQAIATTAITQVTFGTEAFDVGSFFASSAWTPPAGTVLIVAKITLASVTLDSQNIVYLYKDGVATDYAFFYNHSTNGPDQQIMFIGQASGANVYDIRVASNDGNYIVDGTTLSTFFSGTMI